MKKTNTKSGAARIKEICNDMHTSARQLALAVGLKPHNFYDIFSGRCGLSEYTAMKINRVFPDYSIEWMLDKEDSSTSDDANNDGPKEAKVERRPYTRTRAAALYTDRKDMYIEWLQQQLEKERDENKRLLDIILNQNKQHGYENLYIDTD